MGAEAFSFQCCRLSGQAHSQMLKHLADLQPMVEQEDALDALVAERAASIAANSRAAVAAMKKLYGLAQEGRALEAALEAELALEFPEIEDTSERLAGF